ncbi:hypothetical protein GCM10022234_07070 [Aeromicrobium panaciterrae]|uniref:hypothetical protein n=1 Tax=Aeromicrobium panaciterrae TaxID=363861 RepID=UPI0031D1DA45
MWITPDGVTHTNAHANPVDCMTDRMLASLAFVAEHEGHAGADAVFEECFRPPTVDELRSLTPGLEDQWIPDNYLDGDFTTSAALAAYLTSVHVDWRLDAVHAVDDVLASLTEEA